MNRAFRYIFLLRKRNKKDATAIPCATSALKFNGCYNNKTITSFYFQHPQTTKPLIKSELIQPVIHILT